MARRKFFLLTFSLCVLAACSKLTSAPICQDPSSVPLTVGMKVVAQWQNDNWWVGTIDTINQDDVGIVYADQTRGMKKRSEVLPHPDVLYTPGAVPCLKAGETVIAVWKDNSWWKATIDRITNDTVELTYSDGEKGTHTVREMVRAR